MNTQHNRNGSVKYYRLTNADKSSLERASGFLNALGLEIARLNDIGKTIEELLGLIDDKNRLTSETLAEWKARREHEEAIEKLKGQAYQVRDVEKAMNPKTMAGGLRDNQVLTDQPASVSPGSAPV